MVHVRYGLDLRVSSGGVRRWVTKYVSARHTCRECRKGYVPPALKAKPKFCPTLKAWAMYQHIANRMSYQTIEAMYRECFGLRVSYSDIYGFKPDLATYYGPTYKSILNTLLTGSVLHADETHINLRKEQAYAWVLANSENVYFFYRPSRDGEYLKEMLHAFGGVLVSDFYSAYDSLPCEQQKCLVHLVRDMNEDVFRNPFDEEFKEMIGEFGRILRTIVQSIDRHGLRSRHLRKHRPMVDKFLAVVEKEEYQSKIAKKYQRRLGKYSQKLFTFLDHDGVPWNNNAAEHAIKHFARYRRDTDGKVTERGIRDYLVLLSIYQTCEYRNVSFLDFLLAGERDLDEFCRRSNRRRSAH